MTHGGFLPRRDIEIAVEHAAPVLLRGRRGPLPSLGLAPVRTPARIRYVPADALETRLRPGGSWAGGHDEAGLALFEGRLWRRLTEGVQAGRVGGRAERWTMTPGDLVRRLGSWVETPDAQLAGLTPVPWTPTGQTGMFAALAIAEPDPRGLALDLRDAASTGMAERIADRLLHDGTQSWIAIPPPLVAERGGGITHLVRDPVTLSLPPLPGTLATEVEGFLAYLARVSPGGRVTRATRTRMHQLASCLRLDLPDYRPPPLADVEACLRILTMRTVGATMSAIAGHRAAAEAATPHLAGLMPFHARASADLLHADDLPELADRLAACIAAVTRARTEPGDAKSQSLKSLFWAGAYLDAVARPRMLAATPAHAADAESLGSLAP